MAASADATIFIQQELLCYHSRVPYTEGTLGLGLTLEHYPNNGDLSNIVPNLDFVSHKTFHFEKVRQGVWKAPFTHWLPIYINARHADNLSLHEEAIANIARNKYMSKVELKFHPVMVLKVLPSLLNTMIVQIMKGSLFESELALQGYLTFYHLFLAFIVKYPELQTEIDNRVKNFLASEQGRRKRQCPNLGEWLACLAGSSYSWKQVGVAVLSEVFDRNVKWVIMGFPELVNMRELEEAEKKVEEQEQEATKVPAFVPPIATTSVAGLSKSARRRLRQKKGAAWAELRTPGADEDKKTGAKPKVQEEDPTGAQLDRGRLPKTWKTTSVSCRLVMFHVLFLRMFRLRPTEQNEEEDEEETADVQLVSVQKAKQQLDRSFGRATHLLTRRFQIGVKSIIATPDWDGFFDRCLLPKPEPAFLCRWLQRAALNSARKRYHNPEAVNKLLADQKKAKKDERDAAKQAADPFSHFDDDERAALDDDFFDDYADYEDDRDTGSRRGDPKTRGW